MGKKSFTFCLANRFYLSFFELKIDLRNQKPTRFSARFSRENPLRANRGCHFRSRAFWFRAPTRQSTQAQVGAPGAERLAQPTAPSDSIRLSTAFALHPDPTAVGSRHPAPLPGPPSTAPVPIPNNNKQPPKSPARSVFGWVPSVRPNTS